MELNVAQSNSGLLDDLLREAQAISCGGDSRRQEFLGSEKEKGVLDGFGGHWDDSSSVHSSAEKKCKGELLDQNNYMHEDLSNILGLIPSTMQVPLWCSDGGQISIGQSSGVADDNIGLAMQQLTSSLSVTAANWDNMPGIC
ncbi:hypothetical protein L1049_001380 [Liquidambar formosana]|uniref:Uncharacterized protein n=1 Tax=Liquidambar formosana TaxID=63359 RepID=A0AAP0NBE0_LIQFO